MGGGHGPQFMVPKVSGAHAVARWGKTIGHGKLTLAAIGVSVFGSWVLQRALIDFNKDPSATPEWAAATTKYLKFQGCNPIRGVE
mmetsp:Transcript_80860/g.164701  ORF Transcript_80860/g.164701 Transcript_80860/m.164701 type:complete len:85 (+) Transcript_80860:68-322(+)